MSFWNQVIRGKSRKIISIEVLENNIGADGLRVFTTPIKDGKILYGGEYADIYSNKKKWERLYHISFADYGPKKEFRFQEVLEDFIMNLEISPHGETGHLAVLAYPSGDIKIALKLNLL